MSRPVRVIVVGAGIAGLVAAWRLRQGGADVTVLEIADRVGGRMTSDRVDGRIVDRGAQFLSAAYPILVPLAAELGLRLTPTGQTAAVLHGGVPRAIAPDKPWSPWTSGLLGLRGWLGLARASWRLSRGLAGIPQDDAAEWGGHDDEDAMVWAERTHGKDTAARMLEPMHYAFFFQTLRGSSRALLSALLRLAQRRAPTLAVQGGIGRIPEEMAKRLDVRLDTVVQAIEEHPDHMLLTLPSGRMRADYVILATPASAATRLRLPVDEDERSLLATRYSSTINIVLATAPGWPLPHSMQGVYGVWFPQAERRHIAAIGVERAKDPAVAEVGELLDVMLTSESADRLLHLSDAEVMRTILPDLEPLLPGVAAHLRWARLTRWAEAMPRSPIGRLGAVARYRQAAPGRRLLLAGDYMGLPWTDSAAETGQWAAQTVLSAGS